MSLSAASTEAASPTDPLKKERLDSGVDFDSVPDMDFRCSLPASDFFRGSGCPLLFDMTFPPVSIPIVAKRIFSSATHNNGLLCLTIFFTLL